MSRMKLISAIQEHNKLLESVIAIELNVASSDDDYRVAKAEMTIEKGRNPFTRTKDVLRGKHFAEVLAWGREKAQEHKETSDDPNVKKRNALIAALRVLDKHDIDEDTGRKRRRNE